MPVPSASLSFFHLLQEEELLVNIHERLQDIIDEDEDIEPCF